VHLVQHRFASHCCEALFIRAAPVVTQETTKPDLLQTPPSSNPNDIFVSMENLFLYTLDELEAYLGFLLTDRFASHVLRVLLVVLAGASLEKENSKSAMHSKRKEKINVSGSESAREYTLEKRIVPQSFLDALEKIINNSVANQETDYLRLLATHPTGNPTLQTLLKLELSQFGKSRAKDEKSLIHKLLPDNPIKEGTESASFINGMVYDVIGSRLLETIIENAPGKLFKVLYAEFFKERMGSLARNETASYVASKILERLSKDDLEEATRQIADQIPGLVERNRTAVIKVLIERCVVRGVDTVPIKSQLETAYGGSKGFELARLLKLGEDGDGKSNSKLEVASPDKVHGSLLAQTMMTVPGPLGNLIFDSFMNLGVPLTLRVARDPAASRTLQSALTSPNASTIFRRKMIQQLYGHVGELALDPAGSHAIDAVWEGTHGLAFIRERVAEELSENEAALRESHVGRAVWRNWSMDLYKRRRADWVKQSRYTAGNEGFHPFPESHGDTPVIQSQRAGRHMTAIEMARKRHAEAKASITKEDMAQDKTDTTSKGKGKAPVEAH
jgi:nucleolar protein 9